MRLPDAAPVGLVAEKYDSFQVPGSGAARAAVWLADFRTGFAAVDNSAGAFARGDGLLTLRTAGLRAGFGVRLFSNRVCARWVLVMERRLRSHRPLRLLAIE